MEVIYIDLQTSVELTSATPLTKTISNSYLEFWLKHHGLNANFYIGKFNNECGEAERQRLERFGKFFVCTNGRDGYFTDQETARLMVNGDPNRGITPIFAPGQFSPHNLIAYGGLIPSSGIASLQIGGSQPVKILVIDDVARSAGTHPILDTQGNTLSAAALSQLYDKMGDGTLLLASQHFEKLLSPEEREYIVSNTFGENDQIGDDLSTIANELEAIDTAAAAVARKIANFTSTTVSQFRAASPDLPGMIKGTLATSDWCRRLGVDAIIASDCIKGDDGRLSSPGLKSLGQIWINRKSDGKYGKQLVGPQVKGTIPEATQNEFNPKLLVQSQTLADLASDPLRLARYFVEREENTPISEDASKLTRQDYLLEILKADQFGLLNRFSKINFELQRRVRGQWVENAVSGISLPSAMAQHHTALKPWEICNKNLPHGAIVAYYRSPFPNVGAAAIAINNHQAIQQADPEAYRKTGVAYLNPWTAKSIAITDFDGDANGYFVGFLPTVKDLPDQLRAELRTQGPDSAAQYEAGRALFERMICELDPRITTADYPMAVKELIERNAPDKKPPEVVKAPKQKHPWTEGESHGQALWRAWAITADNPTGKVANTGMILQSLAWECHYCPAEQQVELLQTIGSHYSKLLRRSESGRLNIPSNAELVDKGFPAYDFLPRITEIIAGIKAIPTLSVGDEQQAGITKQLNQVSRLLMDMVDGPVATNLQTAVDTAKSCRGIDEDIQTFAKALAYKDHALRQSQKDPNIFIAGQTMPTNTSEPIGWGVEQTNRIYQETLLPELKNEVYRDLFPKEFTPAQEAKALAIAQSYNATIQRAADANERLKEQREEDLKPTILLTSNRTGQSLTLIRPKPAALDLHGQEGLAVSILHENQEKFLAFLEGSNQVLGQVAPNDIQAFNLKTLIPTGHSMKFNANLTSQPAYALQNEPDLLVKAASHQFKQEIGQIPNEERPAYANALWRHSEGMGLVLRGFTPELCQRLQQVPQITLTGLSRDTNLAGVLAAGEYQIRFSENSYFDKQNQQRYFPSVAVITPDGEKEYGAIDARSVRLPYGTICMADITPDPKGKTAILQVTEVIERGVGRYPSEAQPLDKQLTPEKPYNLLQFPQSTTLRAAESSSTYSPVEPYYPSLQELRNWFAAAKITQDLPLQQRIQELGIQLKRAANIDNPPTNFRHSSVMLQPDEQAQMQIQIRPILKLLQDTEKNIERGKNSPPISAAKSQTASFER